MDVKMIFLNDNIDEMIYMVQTKKICIRKPKEYGLKTDKIHL